MLPIKKKDWEIMLNSRKEGLCAYNFFFKEIIVYHVYSECYVLVFCQF